MATRCNSPPLKTEISLSAIFDKNNSLKIVSISSGSPYFESKSFTVPWTFSEFA